MLTALREIFSILWLQSGNFVRRRLVMVLVLVVGGALLTAAAPTALKWVVDDLSGHATGPDVLPVFLIAAYVMSQWLARLVVEVRGFVFARGERRVYRTLSERLFTHIMQLPLRFHAQRETGAINQTLANGLHGFQVILHDLVFTALPVAAELATIALILWNLQQPFFLGYFVAALACYGVAFVIAVRRIADPANEAADAYVRAGAVMTDSILNYETVKYFGAEGLVRQKVSEALQRTESEWIRFHRQFAVNGSVTGTIYAAFLLATLLHAAHYVALGRITLGDFVLINTYMLQIVRPIELLGYAAQNLSQGVAFLDKLFRLLREPAEDAGPENAGGEDRTPSAAGPAEGTGELDFVGVGVSYDGRRTILRSVDFHLGAGRTLGIVGASGAGKSTLVRLLMRLMEPGTGHILLNGERIDRLPLSELRRSIAVVPQDTMLFNDTVAGNIAFGRPGCHRSDIERAARIALMHDWILQLPEGYETRVGERGAKLSGGEKQRLSIARAALRRPQIYVFDEATSSLDSRTEREILHNLRELSRARTTLIIAHRLSAVVHADEIVVLDDGTVRERGTHTELLGIQGHYAALWYAQHPQVPATTA